MNHLAIETRHLRKVFGEKVAVADLTLEVQKGEVFGFLGPNGAGKTTSVKMLLGLTSPTSGEGFLLQRPLGDRLARAKVGFLPEHFRFHEWLKAAEFLDFHGRLYGMSSAERAATIPRLLELVGLGDRAQTKLSGFSKGMLQRVGLAQALLNRPEIVFLDEPTSGLDPIGRLLVRDIIHKLKEEGTAVFLNSHLLGEVELTCDRVAFVKQGTVLQAASVSELAAEEFQIILRVDADSPNLLTALADFGSKVVAEGNGRYRLTVPDESHIPPLAHWLVTNQYAIYELSPHHLSLEERFLQIIGHDTGDK